LTLHLKLRQLQYAFGRKMNPNGRWFNLFLRSDMHLAFDALPSGWALVPTQSVIDQIKQKMEAYQALREHESIKSPWPDFEANIFPSLQSHVHPYAVILNAFPKIRAHTNVVPLPGGQIFDLQYIYNTLTTAWKDAPQVSSTPRGATSRGSPSGTVASNSGSRRSGRLASTPAVPSNDPVQSPTYSHANTDEPGDFDDLFDTSDDDSEFSDAPDASLQRPISISTHKGSIPHCENTDRVLLPLLGFHALGSNGKTWPNGSPVPNTRANRTSWPIP
ncbi:hypothetical protein FRC10_011526, partial [Ceratobasidium sp. 414]